MKMVKDKFIKILIEEASKYDISLNEKIAEDIYIYKELLQEWNEKINLTAITEDDEILTKHFIDSLLSIKYIKESDNIIDIGTGAGFPGLVIAIYFRNKVKVTLSDSVNKKIEFLKKVIDELNLSNVVAICGRVEELARDDKYRDKYDIAIARAVAPLNILLEYMVGYVKKQGKIICMKSVSAEEELKIAKNAIKELKINNLENNKFVLKLEDEELSRNIIIFEKQEDLSDKYPRNFSKIKKETFIKIERIQ